MKAATGNRKLIAALVAAGVVLVGGGAYGVVSYVKAKKNAVPKEFTVAALKADSQDPRKMFEKIHEAMSRPELNDQQREAIHDNARAVMEAQMDQRISAYFDAPEPQRKAILDKQIDEMQAHMKEWQQRRAREEAARGPAGDRAPGGQPGGPPNAGSPPGGPRDGRGPGGHASTPQQRKARSESRDPDASARRMAYFAAMRQRAEERGIQMPFGGNRGH
jgi:uncharacterized membrane protein